MEVGFNDYYAGGYSSAIVWTGDISEIDDDDYSFSGWGIVHF